MLSRVANSIFWMTRYIERAENTARFLDVNLNMSLDTMNVDIGEQWMPLVETSGDKELFIERYGEATAESVKRFLICDPDYPNSIASCVRSARENARTVRETISQPMWEEINKFFLMVQQACTADAQDQTLSNPSELLREVRRTSHTIHGLTNATMTHDDAFHVARLGRLLERADKTSRILDVKYYILLPGGKYDVGSPLDSIQWAALLKSASALHMYRRQHGSIDPNVVAEFLLLDRHFPRSVRSCLIEAQHSLHRITGSPLGEYSNRPEQLLGKLRSELDFTDYETILDEGMHESIDRLQRRINEVGVAIHDEFFALRFDQSAMPKAEQSMGNGRMSQTIGGMTQTMN